MNDAQTSVIAVGVEEIQEFGCPHCGFRSGSMPVQSGGCAVWHCGSCSQQCIVLAEGLERSKIGVGEPSAYPERQAHPRRGTPKHGAPDVQPTTGGEFFRSRGIGLDATPGCFVCGGDERLYHNISAYVSCKEAGERALAMFATGARLDYRTFEPDYVQVKVGACDVHRDNLQHLHELTSAAERTIRPEMITIAQQGR